MDWLLDGLFDWIKQGLIEAIMARFAGLYDTINTQVGSIAGNVGQTPGDWNPGVFAMIRTLSETAVLPIAGMILTFVLCYELIQTIIEKNNMHEFDVFNLYKWIFKTFCAVFILTHTFDIVMFVFALAQNVINDSAGIISGSLDINAGAALANLETMLQSMGVWELMGLWLETFGKWLGDRREPSQKQLLIAAINAALEHKPTAFADFLSMMRAAGYEIDEKRKHITFRLPGRKPMRCDTMGGEYTEQAIRERIAGLRVSSPAGRASAPDTSRRPSLLIDIQTKMQEGKGKGYERWAKLQNLRAMAQTLIYLQEKGLDDYAVLKEKSSSASARFNGLSDKIKDLDARLAANAAMQKHIVTYSKTRNTYVEYRKAGYSKKFKAEHEADIILHQAAKKYFDDLGYGRDKKLPTIASLRAEYAPMLAEKKKAHTEYQQAKTEMRELLNARNNIDQLFNAGRTTEREHDRPTL